MKFYLIFIIFTCFILASVGDHDPIKYGNQSQEGNQTIETKINQI